MYNMRTKTSRTALYVQTMSAETLQALIACVAMRKDEFTNVEITKDNKLFFVFTIDDKTKMFLSVIGEFYEKIVNEIESIPDSIKTDDEKSESETKAESKPVQKSARKSRAKKQKGVKNVL